MLGKLFAATMVLILSSTSVPAQERQWALDTAENDAFLVFGVAESDDVGISFWCSVGSNRLRVMLPDGSAELAPDITAPFVLKIDDKTFTFPGRTSANEMSGETSIETEILTTDPVIGALETADHFSVKAASRTTVFPLADADFAGLLKLCRLKQP